jgi:two-component system, LytTR family, sensor histidine kinase AlgZ
MISRKQQWMLPLLLPNATVVIVLLIQALWTQHWNTRELLHVFVYSLVYANLVAALGLLLVGLVLPKLAHRQISPSLAFALSFFFVVPLGILVVQGLLTAIGFGFGLGQPFWPEYLRILRFCMPLAVVFGLGAIAYASLHDRLQAVKATLHEKEIAEAQAQKLAAEARLRSLESRIHPHFLFNTLNSISSLIAVNPAKAEQMVGRLAQLLRASLDNSNQSLIPLEQELAMVESYLEIEKARFGDKLRASTRVGEELRGARVPPMSVQALVENAVKHGVTPLRGGGTIEVAASADDGLLRIEVRDSGPGFDMTAVAAGHGLDNLVERLNSLFGAKAQLNVSRRDGQSIVEMVLPRE